MSPWKYSEDVRAIARLDQDGQIECMRHSNATVKEIKTAHAELSEERVRLATMHGTETIAAAAETPITIVWDCASDIRDVCLEQDRLRCELESHTAMIRSPFDFRDQVTVGPAWRMGPREGDGGTYHSDGVTGKRGVVKAISPDGYDVEIVAPSGHSYWIPVSRLTVEGCSNH